MGKENSNFSRRFAALPRYLASRPWQRSLLLSEYISHGLSRRPTADARTYLGAYGAAKLALKINRLSNRRGLVSDKMLFDAMLRGSNLPAPTLKAVFGRPVPPGTLRITDAASLRRLLVTPGAVPLFGKPATGQRSEDAIAITGYDADSGDIITQDGTPLSPDALIHQLRANHRGSGYLFQSHIRQHEQLVEIVGQTVATIRVVTLLTKGDCHLLGAMWKIPRLGMVADNTWRGNLIASVDVETGRVGRALAAYSAVAQRHSNHPDTGAAIDGLTLPFWPDLCRVARRAAGLIHVLPLVGWDIAITSGGPMIVEANTSPSLDMLQYVTGNGALSGPSGAWLSNTLAEISVRDKARRRQRRDKRRALLTSRLTSR